MKIRKPKEFIFYSDNVVRIYDSIYNDWLFKGQSSYRVRIYYFYSDEDGFIYELKLNMTDYDNCIKKIRNIYKPSIQIPGII